MKITKSYLKKVIKEEISRLQETMEEHYGPILALDDVYTELTSAVTGPSKDIAVDFLNKCKDYYQKIGVMIKQQEDEIKKMK